MLVYVYASLADNRQTRNYERTEVVLLIISWHLKVKMIGPIPPIADQLPHVAAPLPKMMSSVILSIKKVKTEPKR